MIVNKYDAKLLKYSISKKFYYLGLSYTDNEKEVCFIPVNVCFLADPKGPNSG